MIISGAFKNVSQLQLNQDQLCISPKGELRLSGNHSVTEYEMSGKPYSQKSGLKIHTNERIFQVMTSL